MKLLELPTEMLLAVLEKLLEIGPVTLLGSVPGVCRRFRVLCSGVHGYFDLRSEFGRLDKWSEIQGALNSAVVRFPQTTGLWTFSERTLHFTCKAGLLDVTDALLKEDMSKMNGTDDDGTTPLWIACWEGHLDVSRLLVEKGADMDKATVGGFTPLYMACHDGHLEVARLLVEKGADIDKANRRGGTPLYIACDKGHAEIVAFLEQAGASR